MGDKLRQGVIHSLSADQAAEIEKLQKGLDTFSSTELVKLAAELRRRIFFIDDSLVVAETEENPKTTFGYTYPELYPNTIFLHPVHFEDDSFQLPDASGQEAWIYAVGEIFFHENLHLRYEELGIDDPGGEKAHEIMDQYQERVLDTIMREVYGP